MYYKSVNRSLKPLLLILSLICFAALIPPSPEISASAHVTGPTPLRLGLTVENNTLRPGQTTKVTAQFLDGNYQPVGNDGTRLVEFELVAPAGQKADGGVLSPPQVKIATGAWSAETTFTALKPGKVTIRVRAEGLDPARTTLLITKPGVSYLSKLLETVAYADGLEGFDIVWQTEPEAQANSKSKGIFKVMFNSPPPAGTTVRVRVDAPAVIFFDGKNQGTCADVAFAGTKGVSDNIDVTSGKSGVFNVSAVILASGPEKRSSMKFTEPVPSRIVFDDDVREITSTLNIVRISVHLTDDSGNPLQPKTKRSITLKPAAADDPVEFEPASLDFSPNQLSAESRLRLKGLPGGNEFTIQAVAAPSPDSPPLSFGMKTFTIRSSIQGIILAGPSEVARGNSDAEFTVKLTDKDGKTTTADWDRKIDLTATYGTFSPNQLTIPKGQDRARVKYVSADTTGKVSLKAESRGLTDGSQEIVLITAVYWLVLAALGGGLLGGVVRHLPRSDKLAEAQPKRATMRWTGLVGSIGGSIVSGLFLFLALKLGLSGFLGSLALPSLDYGTILVALFLGGVGGYKGPAVFERLASGFIPEMQKGEVRQPTTSGVH